MKTSSVSFAIALAALLGAGAAAVHAQQLDRKPASPDHWKALTGLGFNESYPSKETSARLYDELQFQRAVQVYLWALPAMNTVAMRDGQRQRSAAATTSSPSSKTAPTPRPLSSPPTRT